MRRVMTKKHLFSDALRSANLGPLKRGPSTTLQLNLGKRCNQTCRHCHVDASPFRTEEMTRETAERCISLLESVESFDTVDFTGGAPELNANFRWLVSESVRLGRSVIDRCNLTILSEPNQEDLSRFLADNGVRVVASLPCYTSGNVDAQRGNGVFQRSIAGLQELNALGYGISGSGLILDLVYNPGGAFLPPAQGPLEADYTERLRADFGIEFSSLLTLANLPVSRFKGDLIRSGKLDEYMELLNSEFNPATVNSLMCKNTISVGWDGIIYDCDFNQMLDMPIRQNGKAITVADLPENITENGRIIRIDDHCLGCTAGAGSSCGGSLA
mgnify:CR=1 FL=1